MKTEKIPLTLSENSSGVSELIGAILMITVVVAAVAIIGVLLFSQQTPEKIPNINFMTGSDNFNRLYLYHNGGDSLTRGSFSVRVDNDIRNDFSISDGGTEWSLGKNLILNNVPSGPHSVAIIYNATGSGEVMLRSASSNVATLQNSINPSGPPVIPGGSGGGSGYINGSNPQEVVNFILGNTSLIGDAINQSPSTVGPVIAHVVGANSISFYKDNRVGLADTSANYFRFNVTKSGSSISATKFGGSPTTLSVGDIVTVYFRSNTGIFKTFGLGDQLWELSATGVDVDIKHNGISDLRTNGDIIHTWITGYQDLGSTMTIQSQNPYTSGTALVVNGTQRINGVNSDDVQISNIRPVGIGLFLLESDNNAQIVYFVGNAQSVTRNGVPVV